MVRATRATASFPSPSPSSSSPVKRSGKTKDAIESIFDDAVKVQHSAELYCICRKPDTGTPMIHCGLCKDWFHFECVHLAPDEAEDINIFVCPQCTQTTGRQTTMTWEGDQALEVHPGGQPLSLSIPTNQLTRAAAARLNHEPEDLPVSDSEEDTPNDDEDDEDEFIVHARRGQTNKSRRRPAPPSDSDETDDDDEDVNGSRRLSRKRRSQSTAHPPPPKRKRTDSHRDSPFVTADDDPTRKFCLGKFQEIFRTIFLRYPFLPPDEDDTMGPEPPNNTATELTDDQKSKVIARATAFSADLEGCVFQTYGEPDKLGNRHAGPKYKDRFRMLQFNLSKPDRVVLHRRIVSGEISPKDISTMSSTDLANEETKQSIKEMAKEALEHSILQRTIAPRAKITHKGLQDIEDVNGASRDPDQDARDHERENDAKREKERSARLKSMLQSQRPGVQEQRTRTASFSSIGGGVGSPLSSPVAQQTNPPSWGAPPSLPSHLLTNAPMTTTEDASAVLRARPQLSVIDNPPSGSEYDNANGGSELELNLNDLINIDDEPSVGVISRSGGGAATLTEIAGEASLPPASVASPSAHDDPLSPSPVGVYHPSSAGSPVTRSPFSPTRQRAPSFDLNSIWSGNNDNVNNGLTSGTSPALTGTLTEGSTTSADMQIDPPELQQSSSGVPQETDDVDFDMILNDQESEDKPSSVEALQEAFDAIVPVWTGKVSMPLDSATPQEPSIAGRQIGGRHIPSGSPLWQVLFPSEVLRIDGRVPTDKSREYLLSMRMSASKELVSVALSPVMGAEVPFGLLLDFLITKNRHGLVFPWGQRPNDHCPGRELYLVPLLASNPLPDFIELLDDLKLPKIRTSNYLIGIWILTRNKLFDPAMQSPTRMSNPLLPTPPLPPLPPLPPPSHPHPPPSTIPNPTQLGPITPSVLAAEMASLTPEQVQLMIRALSASGVSLPSVPPTMAQQNQPSPPIPQQPRWPTPPSSSTPDHHSASPPHGFHGGYSQHYRHRDQRGGGGGYGGRGGGDRGFRGKRGGRGRGRGGGYDDSGPTTRDKERW